MRGAVNYFLNEWDGIEAIATGGDYSWDNNLIERLLQFVKDLLVQFVNLVEDWFTFINRCFFYLCLQFLYLGIQVLHRTLHKLLYLLTLGTELIISQSLNSRIRLLHLVNQRLNLLYIST